MTADDYIRAVIARYRAPTGPGSLAYQAGQSLYPIIAEWANGCLLDVVYSGSYAKGTAILGSTDVDLFISLAVNTPGTLAQLYESLYWFLTQKGLSPRRQNVSIGVSYMGLAVDLVPGRKQSEYTTYHSLYRNKTGTWTQTNVDEHISRVQNSGRTEEIIALKIWRQLHRLEFPSFYLELTVIDALYRETYGNLASNVAAALQYIFSNLTSARVIDPANSNNIVSDDLTLTEKQGVANQARVSLAQPSWGQVIW